MPPEPDDDFDLDDEPESDDAENGDDDEVSAVPPPPRQRIPLPVNRKKDSMKKPKRVQTPTLDEIPREEVLALSSSHEQVILEIRRQLPTGTWSNVRGAIRMPPYALFELQEPVTALAGGGTFVYLVCDTNKVPILPRWKESYDGQPQVTPQHLTLAFNQESGKLQVFERGHAAGARGIYNGDPNAVPVVQQQLTAPAYAAYAQQPPMVQPGQPPPQNQQLYQAALQMGPSPQYQAGRLQPPPSGLVPPWLATFAPDVQWQHVMTERVKKLEDQTRNNPAGAQDGGGLANHWISHEIRAAGDLKAQNAALQQTLANIEARTAERIEGLRKELESAVLAEREKRERAERAEEQAKADARYSELAARLDAQNSQKPLIDWNALVGLAGAFAPVLSARTSAEADTRKSERASEMQLLTAMLTKKESSGFDSLVALAPLITPLALKMMETNGPQAHAELLGIEHEQRMMHLKMMADMLSSISPDPPPAWQPIVEHLINAFGGSMLRGLPGPAQPQRLPPPATSPTPTEHGLEHLISRFAESDADAAADVHSIYQRLPAHLGFHTHEWATILFNVHCRLDPEELAEVVTAHLVHCDRFGNLPGPFANVWVEPELSLRTVFTPLPIMEKDAEYTEQIIRVIAKHVEQIDPAADDDDGVIEGIVGGDVIQQAS